MNFNTCIYYPSKKGKITFLESSKTILTLTSLFLLFVTMAFLLKFGHL